MPANWQSLRMAVMTRDRGSCRWVRDDGQGVCGRRANQVDHIDPGDDHRLSNLRALCEYHHAKISAVQGHEESERVRLEKKAKGRFEGHPGLG